MIKVDACMRAYETPGLVVVPQKPDYSSNVLEIFSPRNLHEALRLGDGDEVEPTVPLPSVNV